MISSTYKTCLNLNPQIALSGKLSPAHQHGREIRALIEIAPMISGVLHATRLHSRRGASVFLSFPNLPSTMIQNRRLSGCHDWLGFLSGIPTTTNCGDKPLSFSSASFRMAHQKCLRIGQDSNLHFARAPTASHERIHCLERSTRRRSLLPLLITVAASVSSQWINHCLSPVKRSARV